jgi:membrane protease YdiL (CAAX protease family)
MRANRVTGAAVEESRRSDVTAVVLLVAIAAAVSWAVSYAFDANRAGAPGAIVALAVTYAVLTAGAIAWALRAGELRRWLVPKTGDLTRGFVAALVLFACAFGFVKLITMHTSPRAAWMARLYLQLGDPRPLREHQAWVGAGIAVMAVMEEIVWRGWVKTLLEHLLGVRFAWVAAAVLYALAHVPTLWALADTMIGKNPLVVFAALGAGLVWSALTRAFGGRLAPSIVSHGLFDWAVLMMFRLWGPSV